MFNEVPLMRSELHKERRKIILSSAHLCELGTFLLICFLPAGIYSSFLSIAEAAYKNRYTCSTLKVWMIMGEQLLKNSILDQFINSHEQSYEEFLNTFTYLLKGM